MDFLIELIKHFPTDRIVGVFESLGNMIIGIVQYIIAAAPIMLMILLMISPVIIALLFVGHSMDKREKEICRHLKDEKAKMERGEISEELYINELLYWNDPHYLGV